MNDELGSTFPDLLIQYRVQEADRIFADASRQHLTIEDVAYAVGFKSRSAFHSAYKRLRQETPGQARRNLSQKMFEDSTGSSES